MAVWRILIVDAFTCLVLLWNIIQSQSDDCLLKEFYLVGVEFMKNALFQLSMEL